MSEIKRSDDAQEFNAEGATVPFYKYTIDNIEYIEFDTSRCGPPEPMVNAMTALSFLKDSGTKVVMINHKNPGGLINKIGENFDVDISNREDGTFQILFSYKQGDSEKADLSQNTCG